MVCDSHHNGQRQTAIRIYAASALHNLMTRLPKLVLECHKSWSTTIYHLLLNSVDVDVLSLENDVEAATLSSSSSSAVDRPPRTYCSWLVSPLSPETTASNRGLLHPCDAALRLLQRLDVTTCLQDLLPLAQEHTTSIFESLR